MHRMWLSFDPTRVMVALSGFLGLLAVVIHLILLSSVRYSWIENGTLPADKAPVAASRPAAAAEMAPLPPNR
jgi:light-harvesting complex 1 alpha chain